MNLATVVKVSEDLNSIFLRGTVDYLGNIITVSMLTFDNVSFVNALKKSRTFTLKNLPSNNAEFINNQILELETKTKMM